MKKEYGSFIPGDEKRDVISDISTSFCPKCLSADDSEDGTRIFPIESEYWTSECYCYGGFGKKTYTIQPHYCKYCDSAFWEYSEVRKIHFGTVMACLLLCIFVTVDIILISVYGDSRDKRALLGFVLSTILSVFCCGYLGTENTHKDTGIESIIRDHYYGHSLNDSEYFRREFDIEPLDKEEQEKLESMANCANAGYILTQQEQQKVQQQINQSFCDTFIGLKFFMHSGDILRF